MTITKHIILAVVAVLSFMLTMLILMHKGKGGGFSNFAESLTVPQEAPVLPKRI